MSTTALVMIYVAMLAFDAAVLGGTAYLVVERGWSAWWMLAAVIVCTGSNPRNIIATWASAKNGEKPTPETKKENE